MVDLGKKQKQVDNSVKNKKKIKINVGTITPIDSLILLHMIEICYTPPKFVHFNKGGKSRTSAGESINSTYHRRNTILPISDIFDIISTYQKLSPNEIDEYIKNHYLKINTINPLYDQIKNKYPNLKWIWNKTFYMWSKNDDLFNIRHKINYIAYNDKDIIVCKICPQFNEINYNKIIFDSIFDIFFLENSSAYMANSKWENKEVTVCIITSDDTKPFYINFGDIIEKNKDNILCIIKTALFNSLSTHNKEIHSFYRFYRMEYDNETPYECINKIIDNIEEKNKEANKKYPVYLLEFFKEIRSAVKSKKHKFDKQKEILEKYDDFDYFESEINSAIDDCIMKYLGLNKKTMDTFNELVECIKNKEEN